MGFRVLLITITGKTPDSIHQELGVTPTSQYIEIPGNSYHDPVSSTTLPSGAYLLYINDDITPDPKLFARLSENASLLACYVNETVMESSASAWRNGTQTWLVVHDAQQALTDLQITGTPPPEFHPIRDRQFAAQATADDTDHIFDIPVDLFISQGGMHYSLPCPPGNSNPKPWRVLNRITPPRPRGCLSFPRIF
jgi:hypothetical protein